MSDLDSTALHWRTKDLTGQTFSRIYVIKFCEYRSRPNGGREAWWSCQCDCGIEKDIRALDLLHNNIKSCGCFHSDQLKKRNTKHGKCRTTEYNIWCAMISRCYNHNNATFPRYGGRGIVVCETWHSSFDHFFDDMGFRPSLDHSLERVDNSHGYNPENCIWVTWDVQQRNRRNNRLITYNNETMCLAD